MIITRRGILLYNGGIYPLNERHVWLQWLLSRQIRFFVPPYGGTNGQNMAKERFVKMIDDSWQHGVDRLHKLCDLYRDATPRFYRDLLEHYKAVERGQVGRTWTLDSIKMKRLTISYKGKGNGIAAFNAIYPYSVIDYDQEPGQQLITVQLIGNDADHVMANIDEGKIADFQLSSRGRQWEDIHDCD